MGGSDSEAWSEESDEETASLNPEHIIEQFSVEEAGESSLKKRKRRKKRVRGQDEKCLELNRCNVLTLLLSGLGVALILAGIILRMEHVPTPSPFVAIPLQACQDAKGDTVYVLSTLRCQRIKEGRFDDAAPEGELLAKLHEDYLQSSIHYMPRLAFPEKFELYGGLSFDLLRDGDLVASASIPLDAYKPQQLYRLGVRGSRVPVYLPEAGLESMYGTRGMCAKLEGCLYPLSETMVEVAALRGTFTIPPAKEELRAIENSKLFKAARRPVQNLELVIKNVKIRAVHSKEEDLAVLQKEARRHSPPEVLISFHQCELTQSQARGVSIMIGGMIILFIGISVLCLSSHAVTRGSKRKEP
eukprot:CAMPEP_0184489552 /NCGR_PEP_ID=MMETSP0113_2-20130426/15769_1 /TAXON_ID=91329 /ORGANISM="Norrisiella sphaerica, Strain BC52" /LENGTH=357 /DNA_ID=CAMNT_0026873041 /DNA_START=184 /DNA_END=1257 /DNA_ORIENTATION=-